MYFRQAVWSGFCHEILRYFMLLVSVPSHVPNSNFEIGPTPHMLCDNSARQKIRHGFGVTRGPPHRERTSSLDYGDEALSHSRGSPGGLGSGRILRRGAVGRRTRRPPKRSSRALAGKRRAGVGAVVDAAEPGACLSLQALQASLLKICRLVFRLRPLHCFSFRPRLRSS